MEKKEGVQRVPYGYFDVKVDSYVQRYKNKRLDFIGGWWSVVGRLSIHSFLQSRTCLRQGPSFSHLALAALWEGEHAKKIGLARGQVGDSGLQLVADVDDGVVGQRDVLVRLPDADPVAGERLLGHAGWHVAPRHADGGGVDAKHLDGGGWFLGAQLECSLQESLALRTWAWDKEKLCRIEQFFGSGSKVLLFQDPDPGSWKKI